MSEPSELPEGWTQCKVDDVSSDVSYGYTASSTVQPVGPQMLRITDIQDNAVDWSGVPYCIISEQEKERYLLSEGDFLFARTGATVGKSFLINTEIPEAVFASYLIRVRFAERSIASLLKFFFNSPQYWGQIMDTKQGTGQPNVNGSKLKELSILLPPLNEQVRIADKLDTLLSRVDTCRARLDRVPGILKRFRQAVLAAATSGELTEAWREQHQTNLSYWKRSDLGSLITKIEAGVNVQCVERPPNVSERGLVKISAVTWAVYNDNESKTLPISQAVPALTRINKGDFLISRANTIDLVGACVIVHKVTRPVFLSDKVLRLVMPENMKHWVLYCLQSPAGRKTIQELSSGNQLSMRNLSQVNLRTIPILIPADAEREIIKNHVERLFAFADRLEARVKAARAAVDRLTPAMLAKAFRGELVPQDPNDEPAAVLLERIRAERAEMTIRKASPKQRGQQKR